MIFLHLLASCFSRCKLLVVSTTTYEHSVLLDLSSSIFLPTVPISFPPYCLWQLTLSYAIYDIFLELSMFDIVYRLCYYECMAKDPITTPSALDKLTLSFEYDVTWQDARKAIRVRTDK